MRVQMEDLELNPDPSWILRTDGEEGHISGQLRESSDLLWNRGEWGRSVAILLGATADRLDDAHEEWMKAQLIENGYHKFLGML